MVAVVGLVVRPPLVFPYVLGDICTTNPKAEIVTTSFADLLWYAFIDCSPQLDSYQESRVKTKQRSFID